MALEKFGKAPFQVECLMPMAEDEMPELPPGEIPYYERYGEEKLKAGHYSEVIRYREHVAPLVEKMNRHALATAS